MGVIDTLRLAKLNIKIKKLEGLLDSGLDSPEDEQYVREELQKLYLERDHIENPPEDYKE